MSIPYSRHSYSGPSSSRSPYPPVDPPPPPSLAPPPPFLNSQPHSQSYLPQDQSYTTANNRRASENDLSIQPDRPRIDSSSSSQSLGRRLLRKKTRTPTTSPLTSPMSSPASINNRSPPPPASFYPNSPPPSSSYFSTSPAYNARDTTPRPPSGAATQYSPSMNHRTSSSSHPPEPTLFEIQQESLSLERERILRIESEEERMLELALLESRRQAEEAEEVSRRRKAEEEERLREVLIYSREFQESEEERRERERRRRFVEEEKEVQRVMRESREAREAHEEEDARNNEARNGSFSSREDERESLGERREREAFEMAMRLSLEEEGQRGYTSEEAFERFSRPEDHERIPSTSSIPIQGREYEPPIDHRRLSFVVVNPDPTVISDAGTAIDEPPPPAYEWSSPTTTTTTTTEQQPTDRPVQPSLDSRSFISTESEQRDRRSLIGPREPTNQNHPTPSSFTFPGQNDLLPFPGEGEPAPQPHRVFDENPEFFDEVSNQGDGSSIPVVTDQSMSTSLGTEEGLEGGEGEEDPFDDRYEEGESEAGERVGIDGRDDADEAEGQERNTLSAYEEPLNESYTPRTPSLVVEAAPSLPPSTSPPVPALPTEPEHAPHATLSPTNHAFDQLSAPSPARRVSEPPPTLPSLLPSDSSPAIPLSHSATTTPEPSPSLINDSTTPSFGGVVLDNPSNPQSFAASEYVLEGVRWGFVAIERASMHPPLDSKGAFPRGAQLSSAENEEGKKEFLSFAIEAKTWDALLIFLMWFGKSRIEASPHDHGEDEHGKGHQVSIRIEFFRSFLDSTNRVRCRLELLPPSKRDLSSALSSTVGSSAESTPSFDVDCPNIHILLEQRPYLPLNLTNLATILSSCLANSRKHHHQRVSSNRQSSFSSHQSYLSEAVEFTRSLNKNGSKIPSSGGHNGSNGGNVGYGRNKEEEQGEGEYSSDEIGSWNKIKSRLRKKNKPRVLKKSSDQTSSDRRSSVLPEGAMLITPFSVD